MVPLDRVGPWRNFRVVVASAKFVEGFGSVLRWNLFFGFWEGAGGNTGGDIKAKEPDGLQRGLSSVFAI